MKRRNFLKSSMASVIGGSSLQLAALAPSVAAVGVPRDYSEKAVQLVAESNVIDMLNLFNPVSMIAGQQATDVWQSVSGSFTRQDADDYLEVGVNVYSLGHVIDDDPDTEWQWFAKWNGFIASNARFFDRIDTVEKLRNAGASGKTGIILSTQSAFHFRELDDINLYFSLGQRVAQLSHNQSNHIATAGFDDNDKGLSDFGSDVVHRMQEVGMTVDVSHCSDMTTLQTLEIARSPVLITHAPCRALNPGYSRGKTDEMIRKMAATGGVIGIPVLRFMIRDREPVTVEHFLDHIDHVVNLAGIEHVGIGSDQGFDTEDDLPLEVRQNTLENAPPKYKVHTNENYQIGIDELNHPMRIFDITEGLLRRGYSDDHIRLVLGGNFERALTETWTI